MDYRIFNVRTDVNACDCTRECKDTGRGFALKVDSGRKIPSRTRESNLHQRRTGPMLYQLSYIPNLFIFRWPTRESALDTPNAWLQWREEMEQMETKVSWIGRGEIKTGTRHLAAGEQCKATVWPLGFKGKNQLILATFKRPFLKTTINRRKSCRKCILYT